MTPWLALLIPIIAAVVVLYRFKHKVLWWELLIPIAASALSIAIFKVIAVSSLAYDTEYRGSLIVSARYYEAWETYVHRTCTRTVSCGKNCSRTVTYDCSYCDRNSAYWVMIDTYGREWPITEEHYEKLRLKWNATPVFIELDRDINKTWSCGKDGDAYEIHWNMLIETSEAPVMEKGYTNRTQTTPSTFKYEEISKEEAKRLGLYNYPKIDRTYRQPAILGLDSLPYSAQQKERIHRHYEYFNGYYGPKKHVKLFVLLFPDKPLSIAHKQESYWAGGNDNEVVVCIGLNSKTQELTWVKAFSWCINKRILVDCREDIMEDSTFDALQAMQHIAKTVEENFQPRDLEKDFSYLDPEIPTWCTITVFILTVLITVGLNIWCITNEYEYVDPTGYRNRR